MVNYCLKVRILAEVLIVYEVFNHVKVLSRHSFLLEFHHIFRIIRLVDLELLLEWLHKHLKRSEFNTMTELQES